MWGRRALVVEDDDRIIPLIAAILSSVGHDYEWVTNQADAEAKLASDRFDYILLDLEIPARPDRGGASTACGADLLRKIRETKGQGLPVIIMTGQTSACIDMARQLMRHGASDFISKPFPERGHTLGNVICGVLGGRPELADSTIWLTVTQCAEMLLDDVSGLDLRRARARVSKAADKKFKTNGKTGSERLIDRDSFSTWRLRQRAKDLARGDEAA